FILVLGIGFVFFFKSKGGGEKEYFLGGRSMGPWVTALSAQASDMSAWLLMGLPGSILAFGFGEVWIGIGLALGTAANWIFTAKRLRRFSKAAGDSITLPQYLSNRFGGGKTALQTVCALIFLVCFTVYVASAFVAGTDVFTTVFPALDRNLAMVIFAAIILVYTFLGGFKAVCWTDFFQGFLMLAAVLAVPILAAVSGDANPEHLKETYTYIDANKAEVACAFVGTPFEASWQDIASGLAWGLGYFGMPHILVRFMSIRKAKEANTAATVAIIWVVIALAAVTVMAILGRMIVGPEILADGSQKMVFIVLAKRYFHPLLAGLLMSSIIAASMSTADSQLLVASSSFTSDIYKPLIRKGAKDGEVMWIGRLVVVIVAVIAFFVASSKGSGAQAIMNLVENAWAGFGSAFGPVVILSLFWKRFNYQGALAGVVAGAVVDVVWLFSGLSASTGIYELIPGFAAGLIASVVVALLTKKPDSETVAIFETATAPELDD
ncbi:MAG: sodium/proline symporter, partial [Acutalibacteraceae bacterium]|nr:sodium/proline symporter [Acutalibacteraceae bacterium]